MVKARCPLMKSVRKHFERNDLRYQMGMDGDRLLTGFRGARHRWNVTITAQGNTLVFAIVNYLHVQPEHREALLTRLADLNYRWLVTRIGMDESDGEVRLELVLPWVEGKVKDDRIRHALTLLLTTADAHFAELSALNRTGCCDDGTDDPEEDWLRRHPRPE